MNGRYEEDLIRCAFDDMTESERAELRQRATHDASSQKLLAEYDAMRQGLRALREIPEPQLSTERLRDAILREGLRPEPLRAPWWRALAWPVGLAGAAACAFLVTMNLRSAPSVATPKLVMNETSAPKDEVKFELPLKETMRVFAPPAMRTPTTAPTVSPVRAATVVRRPKREAVSSPAPVGPRPEVVEKKPSQLLLASNQPTRDEMPSAPVDVAVMAAAPPEAPVVVIEDSPATMNGRRAVEVESANALVVGG